MIDWKSYLPGLGNDDEEDAVTKTLRTLQQGASDVGTGISSAASSAGEALGTAWQSATAPATDFTPRPEYQPQQLPTEIEPGPTGLEIAQNVGSTLAEGARAGAAAADPYITGPARTPPSWEDPLAPVREVAEHVTQHPLSTVPFFQYGDVQQAATDPIGRRLVEAAGGSGTEPAFRATIPESVPFVGGKEIAPTPQDIGGAVGSAVLDPLNLLGAGAAAAAGKGGRTIAAEAVRGLPLVGEGEALIKGGAGLARRGVSALGEALEGNAGRLAAADARMAAEGSTALPATFGALPEPGPTGPAGRTVEVLREQLDTATASWQRAREAGDERMAALAREHAVALEGDLADALNARRGLEPAITSDVGRRVESLPLAEETADTLGGAGSRRADIEGLGGPVSHVPSSINLNAGFGALPTEAPRRATAGAAPAPRTVADQVMETYRRVTPERVAGATNRAVQIAGDAIARRIPATGGLTTPPDELMRATHAAVVRNLEDTKVVATGLRQGALEAYLRGEGLTSKVETRDLGRINEITQKQVNVAGSRAGKPYTIEEAADFAQRESEQMRAFTGGTRFPDPVTGAIDEDAPRVLYGYVSEGQPLIGPNRPAFWLVHENHAPRASSVNHPFGAISPGQDIHANMAPGNKAMVWAPDAVRGGRVERTAVGPEGRLVPTGTAEGAPLVRHWEEGAIDAGGGRKIADTNYMVGPEGESDLRASALVSGMSNAIQQQIARGELVDPELIAAGLMRGGAPKWGSGWASIVNPTRTETLLLDPSLENVRAIYITGTPKSLQTKVARTGMTELQVAEKMRADILEQYGKDVPILFTDISKKATQYPGQTVATPMARAQVLAGRPLETPLSPGRQRIVDQYTQVTDPTTGKPYTDIGVSAGALPATRGAGALASVNRALGEGIAGGVGGAVIEQATAPGSAQGEDESDADYAVRRTRERVQRAGTGFAAGAVGFPAATRLARGAARLAGAGQDLGGGARIALGDVPPSQIRRPVLPGTEPMAPGAVAEDFIPAGPGARPTGTPGTAPSSAQGIGDALPEIIRQLNAPPPAAATEGASLPLVAPTPGRTRRAANTAARLLSSGLNKVQTARIAGMLSDTAGQLANVAGGPVLQAIDITTGPIAAALDVGRVAATRAVGKEAAREVFFSETGERLKGMARGGSIGLGRAVDVIRGGLDAGEAAKLEQRGGFGTNIPGIAPAGSPQAKVADFAAEAPLRALGAADAVFKTSAQGGHLMAEAYAAARKANGGRSPSPEQIRAAAQLPEVLERVQYLSSRSVLQEDRMLTNWYKRAMNYHSDDPVEQVVADGLKAGLAVEIPFVRTPYNVVAQGMGMTPAGLLGVIQDVKQGKSARETEQRLARVMLGTAVMAPVAAGIGEGRFTGPYPETEKERSMLPPGWRPWSAKVDAPNGETYYLPLSYAQGLAMPIVMGLLAREAYKKDGWSIEAAGKVAAGVGEYVTQETFLEGFGAIGRLLDSKASPRTWQREAEQIAASYVPFSALGREMQRLMGMPARDPEGPWEAMQATNPLTAGNVEPRQDVLGREASLGLGGPAGAFVRAGVENDTGVLRAFRQAGEGLPMQAPDSIPDPTTGRPRPLSEHQQHRWRRVFGAELRSGWANAGAPSDAESLRKVESKARTAANQTLLGMR